MTSTNNPQVTCLACNLKVEIKSTKNILKTAFADTGENLATFVSKTLLSATNNLQSPHLCLQCLNWFGKLEQAQRKVKSIKSEILKTYLKSHNGKIKSHDTIQNVRKGVSTNSQVPSVKPRAVITQCVVNKSVNVPTKKRSNNNVIVFNVLDTEKLDVTPTKNDNKTAQSTKLKLLEQDLKEFLNLDASSVSPNTDKTSLVSPSLEDHQYSQLPTSKTELDPNIKIDSSVQQEKVTKVVEKVSEKKSKKVSKSSYTCPKCGQKESTLKDLRLHYVIHSDFHSYVCERCGKVYKSQKALKIHVDMHDGISPFNCPVCDKCFSQKSALKRHLPIHTGEKPYECEICSKKFRHHTTYNMHTLSHNKEKMHKCHICFFTFRSTSHLNRHLRIHTGDKRHSCDTCGKRFFERYNLVSHMKVHDPERNRLKEFRKHQKRVIERRCERCNIDFASAGEYNVHLHSHNPENMNDQDIF